MTNERIDELLALAARGELTDDDERQLDALLADDPAESAGSNVSSLDQSRARRHSRWQPFAAAAAAVLLVAGGLFVASNRADAPGPIDAVMDAPDATTRPFEGTLAGKLDMVFSSGLDAFVIQGTDVPVVTDAETYQLWLADPANGFRSVGLFRPNDDGSVAVRFDGYDPSDATVAITIEPAAGSDTPTEPIVATA